MTKITVALTSYNHAPFVGEAIESVLSQKGCDLELIIVDDCSTDESVKEIKKFKDPRLVSLFLEKNEGACVAIRKAIESGKGEYVAILSSDDQYMQGKLEKQASFLDQHPHIAAVFTLPLFINSFGRALTSKQHFYGNLFRQSNKDRFSWLNHFFYKSNALCHPSVMIRRECYNNLGYYDPRMAQLPDFDFWVRLVLHHDIYILQEELLRFRILPHEANTSAPKTENRHRAIWELVQILPHFFQLSSKTDYLKAFPEDTVLFNQYLQIDDKYIIPYALAQKALSEHTPLPYKPAYYFFGLQTLFALFNDPFFTEQVAPKLNFSLADCTQLAKRYKIFDLNKIETSFYQKVCNRLKKIWLS